MNPTNTLALGINLHLFKRGGRQIALPGGHSPESRFTYRPNWGLPGWADGDQTAAPVLGFSSQNINPGESSRAVIVPLFPEEASAWFTVRIGEELRLYEGLRVCGRGTVIWTEPTTLPLQTEEEERFAAWLTTPP